MFQVWYLLLASSTLVSLVNCSISCPYSACTCTSTKIDCTHKGLTTLPPLLKGNFTQTALDISYNSLTAISIDRLPPGLQTFTSQHNPLTTIDDHAFDLSIATLRTLTIYDNALTRIPDVSNMTHLQSLNILGNTIKNASTARFPESIAQLSLFNNSLAEIPPAVSTLDKLTTLYLGRNDIRSIDSFVFPSSLTQLHIYVNKIETISQVAFSQNTSEVLSFSVDNNPLKQIANDAFAQMPKMQVLSLRNTGLTRLPLTIGALPQLRSVYLVDIPALVCTCQEAALAGWYRNLTFVQVVHGDCGASKISFFLSDLAPNCPKSRLILLE